MGIVPEKKVTLYCLMNADMVKPEKYDFISRFSLSLYNIFKELIIDCVTALQWWLCVIVTTIFLAY